MSVINKMLQDLDARGNARSVEMPVEIKPVTQRARGVQFGPLAALTALLLALMILGAAWLVLARRAKPPVPLPAPVQVQAPPLVSAPAVLPALPAASVVAVEDTSTSAAPAAAAPLTASTPPAPVPDAVAVAPSTSATTPYEVAHARFTTEQTRLARRWHSEEARIARLPAREQAAARQRLQAEQARAANTTEIETRWLAVLKRRAGLAVSTPPAPSAVSAPVETGRVEPSAPGAEDSYRRALQHLQEGRSLDAIGALQQALRSNPRHEAARQTLVGLLVENKREDEAMAQLQQALALDARQPALAMLLARLQIERGKSGIETLQRSLPYANGNGEYHAFLGGAFQRAGRQREAAEQYQAALRVVPTNAVWWMGLGIALQGEQRRAEAHEAYRQAKSLATLPAELQGFVEQRLLQVAR